MTFPKNKISWIIIIFFIALLLSPLIMHLFWVLKPEKSIDIIIVDKTVVNNQKNEHASLNWLLNNLKINRNSDKTLYSNDDYYGFFPLENEKFYISDFEKMDSAELKNVLNKNQMIYITDTYGVYSNEWYKHALTAERSQLIYGGLSKKEIEILKFFKDQKKLIIAEFNCIGSPTEKSVRNNFEELFHIRWTGWMGRYFSDLSETNPDIPHWLVNNFKKQHQNKWSFSKSGIAFVNENDKIEILEAGRDLTASTPIIYTNKVNSAKYNLPKEIPYPYWFDILQMEDINIPISLYHINTTGSGDSIMSRNGILKTFPAVISHNAGDYEFFYFAGDFADNNISRNFSHFSGIPFIKSVESSFHEDDRENFYWNYYYPLMSKILEKYYDSLRVKGL